MSTPWSWSRGSGRQADEGRWSRKVMEMGQGTDKDEKGKKGGRTMTPEVQGSLWSMGGLADLLYHIQQVSASPYGLHPILKPCTLFAMCLSLCMCPCIGEHWLSCFFWC